MHRRRCKSLPPWWEGGPAGPDEGRVCCSCPQTGGYGRLAPHQSVVGATDSFPQRGSQYNKKPPLLGKRSGGSDCRKRCAHPLAPSARGLRPQAVGERTVQLSEIFRAMARFSPSAPLGHLPRRGRFFDTLSRRFLVKEAAALLWRTRAQHIYYTTFTMCYSILIMHKYCI